MTLLSLHRSVSRTRIYHQVLLPPTVAAAGRRVIYVPRTHPDTGRSPQPACLPELLPWWRDHSVEICLVLADWYLIDSQRRGIMDTEPETLGPEAESLICVASRVNA
ncbi:hypothetical protein J6590_034011 [Homalodisca vitripennis]|nr:hypothetical protein J6590_034011 [Homalodisca vitripennis]